MSHRRHEPFDDLPILAELREALGSTFERAERSGRVRRGHRAMNRLVGLVPVGLAAAVTAAVAAVALTTIGHHRSAATPHAGRQPAGAGGRVLPGPSSPEQKAVDAAQRTTIARDHACAPPVNRGATFIHGAPQPSLLALLGVLRRPAAPPDGTRQTLFRNGFDIGAGVYVDYIRRARSAYGKSFYIIPEARTVPFGPIPARCYTEMRIALLGRLAGVSAAERERALSVQDDQFAAQRAETEHRAGVCFAAVAIGHGDRMGGVDMGCTPSLPTLGNAMTGWLGEDHRHGGALMAGIVPDGVATVTLSYAAGGGHPARTLTSTAVDNVVAFEVPPHTAHQDSPTAVVWRAADGRVLHTMHR